MRSMVGKDSLKSEARRPKAEGNPKSERQSQKSSMTTKERKEHKERGHFPPLCGLCAPLRLVLQLAPEVRIGSASALPLSRRSLEAKSERTWRVYSRRA
jgi:hypothetical protein